MPGARRGGACGAANALATPPRATQTSTQLTRHPAPHNPHTRQALGASSRGFVSEWHRGTRRHDTDSHALAQLDLTEITDCKDLRVIMFGGKKCRTTVHEHNAYDRELKRLHKVLPAHSKVIVVGKQQGVRRLLQSRHRHEVLAVVATARIYADPDINARLAPLSGKVPMYVASEDNLIKIRGQCQASALTLCVVCDRLDF